MDQIQKMHYKDSRPEETVLKLKDILNENNIELEEKWSEENAIDTFSLRLIIKGTDIGTNGKGISKELARASAYAEFFERFQNKALGSFYFINVPSYHVSRDEKILSCKELANNQNALMNYYFSKLGLDEASSSEKVNHLNMLEVRDMMEYGLDKEYVALPFLNVNQRAVEYLPYSIYRYLYSSNGMCAGNTKEEALVQGFSEIIERLVQKKLFLERPCLPDIPDSYIKKFPEIYSRYLKIKSIKGYQCYFKDCSFGGQYPVAALIIVEKNTGNYGVKLGCHPDYGIAMERTITEITQGQDITDFSNNSSLDFNNNLIDDERNIYNSFKAGVAQYPYELMGNSPTYPFKEMPDISGFSNKKILDALITDVINQGYNIYIRDESTLGFPTFHIIIPGVSESLSPSITAIKAYNTRLYLKTYIKEPELITKKICKYLINILSYFKRVLLEDRISSFYIDAYDCNSIPAENINASCDYMMISCLASIKEYSRAAKIARKILDKIGFTKLSENDVVYYRALYHYLVAMSNIEKHEQVMPYISIYFEKDICDRIDYIFAEGSEIIKKQYLSIDKMPKKYDVEKEPIKNAYLLYQKICNQIIPQENALD